MTVHFISRHAQDAVATARILRAAGSIRPDRHTFDVPAWRFRVEDVARLTGGAVDRKTLADMGFRPAVGAPDAVSIVCGEGPAAVIARLTSRAPAAA